MRKSCFKMNALTRRGFVGFFKALTLSVMSIASFAVSAAIEPVDGTTTTVRVETLEDLKTALKDPAIETIIVKKCITLTDGTELDG